MKILHKSCIAAILMGILVNQVWAQSCPSDMVGVGPVCVDKYEASVWSDAAGTGTRYGATTDDYPCNDNGNDCPTRIYAVSRERVTPSRFITWFQAQQACANVGKRLLTNAEWQMAAAGTPDPGAAPTGGACNTNSGGPDLTGVRALCVSAWGAFDLVGNVWEWVGDWMQANDDIDGGDTSTGAYGEDGIFGVDEASPVATRFPAALLRGGSYPDGAAAGVFALWARSGPAADFSDTGFRCGLK